MNNHLENNLKISELKLVQSIYNDTTGSKYTKKYENAITFSEKDAFYSKEITYYYKELNLAKPSH